ncbi:molybdopterin converting factor subunit 1 [Azospirillum sp. A39]|uniref:molybdopterin converting factor subunit 1 n=1 Tax=Azospirillum sp. A39 TaxID=3462279 RepID=UPI0040462081
MKVLYFAWLRTKVGVAAEDVTPPADVADVGGLVEWLKGRSPRHAEALANTAVVKVAVNQEHVPFDHPVAPGDEVALFPPVTGG